MFVGFNIRIKCEKLVKNCENRTTHNLLTTGSRVNKPQKGMWEAHAETWKFKCQKASRDSSHDLANSWDDPRDALPAYFSVLSSFLYPHYKSSHYPWNWKENFREKTLEMHLKVRDCTPTIIYTFLLVFLYSYLSNYISLRVLNPNTYITQFECCELFWCLWEVLDKVIYWWMQLELIAGSR